MFGESLESFGVEAASSEEFDLRNRASGALLVGPPDVDVLHTRFRDGRPMETFRQVTSDMPFAVDGLRALIR